MLRLLFCLKEGQMTETPIYTELIEQAEEDALQEAMGENYNCPACYQLAKGWGGNGCCEICDRTPADHDCERKEA